MKTSIPAISHLKLPLSTTLVSSKSKLSEIEHKMTRSDDEQRVFGVMDMAGNVWEWTSSLWGADYQKQQFDYPYNPNDGRETKDAPNTIA
ncbi:MAG: SUMF1/EgtB/PvdO family nonheme iron enzyme [Chloroflexi bacterium]|jgi:formylglycine-generating enzyme required for sulfatase activity|nr:SUMF1/EgtB/PvdO family nonheme iron enzyme [Chloroflexota bacterium]